MMITKEGYEYIAIVFGTFYLMPQIILAYKVKTLQHYSTLSLLVLIFATVVWVYYLYNNDDLYYAVATGFVTMNAVVLLCMKYTYYVGHLKRKLKELDDNDTV